MIKRAGDLCVAALGLLLCSPLLLLAGVAVKLSSPGPVLFRQQRVGRNFQPFLMNKFRTMIVDAPQRGPQVTAGRDPRITRVGHWLRASKIDEMPQLWNVLVGDMSLVGPRPEVPRYVERFRDEYREVLTVRPGITDLASIKYRHEAELLGQATDPERCYVEQVLPDKLALAREYIRRQSLGFDLRIIAGTVLAILRGGRP